jgi:K+-transporting ATPase ATPase B chain
MTVASPPARSIASATGERRAASDSRPDSLRTALRDSVIKLDPRLQIRNPAIFVVELGALITTLAWLILVFGGQTISAADPASYTVPISLWLWLTALLANLAECVVDGRGRARALTLRATRRETRARMLDGAIRAATELTHGDVVVVAAGEVIPGDGTIVKGIASVDESAMTGESAPVVRESGRDRSQVTAGTRVLSDRIVVEITQEAGQSLLDRRIAQAERRSPRRTPGDVAFGLPLLGLALVVIIVVALRPFGSPATAIPAGTLTALLVAMIPASIAALVPAIRAAAADRPARGEIASEFIPMPGVSEAELATVAQLASLADETPEGRSIVVLAKRYGLREHELSGAHAEFVPVSRATQMSGVDLGGRRLRKGAGDAVTAFVTEQGGRAPAELEATLDRISREGGIPMAVARDAQVLGVIDFREATARGNGQRFHHLRASGSGPLT